MRTHAPSSTAFLSGVFASVKDAARSRIWFRRRHGVSWSTICNPPTARHVGRQGGLRCDREEARRAVHRELPEILEQRWRAGQGGIARRVNGLLRRKIARCSYAYEHGIDKPEIVRWKWLINLLNAGPARHTKLAHIQTVPKGQNSEAAPLPLQKPANVLRAGFHSMHFTSILSVVAEFFFDS